MKTKLTLVVMILFGYTFNGFSQSPELETSLKNRKEWKVFSEIDLGLLAFTGGYSNFFGVRKGPHSYELGYQHFPAPSEAFSGKPEGFDLTVEHIYSVHYPNPNNFFSFFLASSSSFFFISSSFFFASSLSFFSAAAVNESA